MKSIISRLTCTAVMALLGIVGADAKISVTSSTASGTLATGVVWNSGSKTLTLTNATIADQLEINTGAGCTIKLVGTNNIGTKGLSYEGMPALYLLNEGPFTITSDDGTGVLNCYVGDKDTAAICVSGYSDADVSFAINNCVVHAFVDCAADGDNVCGIACLATNVNMSINNSVVRTKGDNGGAAMAWMQALTVTGCDLVAPENAVFVAPWNDGNIRNWRYWIAGGIYTNANGGSLVTDEVDFEMSAKKITTAGYASYSSAAPRNFSSYSGDLTLFAVYVATDQEVRLKEIDMDGKSLPANTGIVIKGAAGNYTFPVDYTSTVANVYGNKLEASLAPTILAAGDYYFGLSTGGTAGFFKHRSTSGTKTIPECGAYLPGDRVTVTGGAKTDFLRMVISDEATGIDRVAEAIDNYEKSQGTMYNLAGQRVAKGYKGMVIVNGKKYINK